MEPNFRSLKPNQVVQGTIVKLFPNNQALIQIGHEQRLAQLDTALVVGEKYYFQVVKNEQYIHLKVLGEPIQQETTLNIEALLQQLSLPTDRQTRQFVQHLIQEQVPFDRNTLLKSLPILSISDNKQMTFQIIKQMIVQQLPLTRDVFLALQTVMNENFSSLLKHIDEPSVRAFLNDTIGGRRLLSSLQDYTKPIREHQFSRHLLQLFTQNESLGRLFQGLNLIKQHISLNEHTLQSLLRKQESIFNVETSTLRSIVQRIVDNQQQIVPRVHVFLATWEQELKVYQKENQPLPVDRLLLVSEQLRPIFQTFLSNEQITTLMTKLQQQNQIPLLLNTLVSLSNDETYTALHQPVTVDFSPKVEFLQQIKHTLTYVGLNYEQLLQEGQVVEQPLTLKQTLLQMFQQQLPIDQDRIQQLIHFINGLQIQSVEETNYFIYGNFVLPGEKLNLNSDLYMQFQSKKIKDRSIDPNHCRILFFLHLKTLDHTIVDMNIQDRVISLTVYNDQTFLKSLAKPFENRLKKRLKEMDYQLSSISYKRLEEGDKRQLKTTPQPFMRNNYSGVDFRI